MLDIKDDNDKKDDNNDNDNDNDNDNTIHLYQCQENCTDETYRSPELSFLLQQLTNVVTFSSDTFFLIKTNQLPRSMKFILYSLCAICLFF